VPSEVQGLKWSDIAWDVKRITVRSPKTEHHEGKDTRVIPLFKAIEDELLALWSEAEEGAELVFDVRADSNLRTQLQKILRRAGVKQWPKLWQNLRASGCTDLAKNLPVHVATAIAGHSIQIAQEHYWTVTDVDFDKAIGALPAVPTNVPTTDGETSRTESIHEADKESNPGQKPAKNAENGGHCRQNCD
jgi:integrase